MRQHFSVGVRPKIRITVLDQLLLEHLVIFDYAVVNQGDLAGGVEMRVGVLVVDLSVRCPAGVADSV